MNKTAKKFKEHVYNAMALVCILAALTVAICATAVYSYESGVHDGRSEIITMAVTHHHADWVCSKDGTARLEWRLISKIDKTCVRWEK